MVDNGFSGGMQACSELNNHPGTPHTLYCKLNNHPGTPHTLYCELNNHPGTPHTLYCELNNHPGTPHTLYCELNNHPGTPHTLYCELNNHPGTPHTLYCELNNHPGTPHTLYFIRLRFYLRFSQYFKMNICNVCNVKYICIAPPYGRAVTVVLVLVQKHTNMTNCPTNHTTWNQPG